MISPDDDDAPDDDGDEDAAEADEQGTAAFTDLGISPQARAETIALEEFVELTKLLS